MNTISKHILPHCISIAAVILMYLFLTTPMVFAQSTATSSGFARQGIFGCSGGEAAMASGIFQTTGGPYVPVSDRSVTINTGNTVRNTSYLVYKECVLDGMVVATREAATASLVKNMLEWFNRGNAGNPHYIVNWNQYFLNVGDQTTIEFLKGYRMDSVCAPFKNQVQGNLARQYIAQTGRLEERRESFSCTFPGSEQDLVAFNTGTWGQDGYGNFFANVTDPANHPLGAYHAAQEQLLAEIGRENMREQNELMWAQGALPVVRYREEPTASGDPRRIREVVTPGFLVAALIEQGMTSGFRQLESASEVGSIITSAFSSLGNQVLTNNQGLIGINEPPGGGQPSYLSQLLQDSIDNLQQTAANAALDILRNWRNLQLQFQEQIQGAKDALTQAKGQLRSAERQCWGFMEEAVEELNATSTPPIAYTVATSTQFSTLAIAENIEEPEEVIDAQLDDAEVAIELIDALIEAVTDENNPLSRREALEQLDLLFVTGALRTERDVMQAQTQRQNMENEMNSTVEDTLEEWTTGDGWCNVNNDAVVEGWREAWRD